MSKFLDDPDTEKTELPEGVEKAPLPLRIIGKVIKYTFWAVVLCINVLIIWRMFSTGLPSRMKTLYVDDELKEAYAAYLADTSEEKSPFVIYNLYCYDRPMTVVEKDEENGIIGNYGYFGVVDQAIIPSANQAQFIFRYNNSTLEHLAEDYVLEGPLDKNEDYYDLSLRVLVYKDKDNKEAGTTEERIKCRVVDSDRKNVYNYRQAVAHDLPDIDDIKEIYVDIYYDGDVNYEVDAYGSVRIYTDEFEPDEYELDKKDIKALKGE